jgi:hypothetical protein
MEGALAARGVLSRSVYSSHRQAAGEGIRLENSGEKAEKKNDRHQYGSEESKRPKTGRSLRE